MRKIEFRYLAEHADHPVFQELAVLLNRALQRELSTRGYDLHINLNSLIAGHTIARSMARHNIPVIFDIGDDLPESFAASPWIPSPFKPLARHISRTLMESSVRTAQRVTCVTRSLSAAYALPDGKTIHVPNGVDCTHFRPLDSSRLRGDLGFHDDDFVCGFLGVLNGWVDLETPFTALRSLRKKDLGIRMLVVGGGDRLPYYRELARKMGLEDAIIFTGPTPYSEGPAFISAMDLCLICRYPSKESHHSLPLKLLEYMACEKPVVSPKLAGVQEAAGDQVIYAQTPEELEEVITHCCTDPDRCLTRGASNREYVQANYTWDHTLTRFDRAMEEAVHGAEIF
jgi:glycosyltransferase involved in cell wall biosynthesis